MENKKNIEKELELLSKDIVDSEREIEISKNKFLTRLKNGLADEIKTTQGPKITKTPKWKLILKAIGGWITDKWHYFLYWLNIYK
jgi:hypothetical protein